MFEKEAKEYVPNINWHAYSSKEIREEMMVCYRKGAEFCYNKAKEIIKSLLSVTNENGLKFCDMYGNPSVIKQAEDFIKE